MKKQIKYDLGEGSLKNWIITETEFNKKNQSKFEPLFGLGNGYMGSRTAHEEEYLGKQVGYYVSGSYNNSTETEAPELPNAANIWDIALKVNGEVFTLDNHENTIENYERSLNMKDASVSRKVTSIDKEGRKIEYVTERFISLENKHLAAQKATIKIDKDALVEIKSGICGETTNYGSQHFIERHLSFQDKIMELVFETNNSGIIFNWNRTTNVYLNGEKIKFLNDLIAGSSKNRRNMFIEGKIILKAGDILEYEVINMLNTSRDVEYEKNGIEMDELRNISLDMIKSIRDFRYDELKTKSAAEAEKWFNELGVEIDTEEDWDIISTRYALFKTRVFTPINDYRMNIDAKGLSSSRYRGHSFWDTEACVIPYFLMSKPELAKQLLESDYFMRESAIKKASDLGRKGYAWPWESAWKEHGEACSKLSYVDINTGEKVKSKIYHTQIHRGVDIILAVEQYYNSTKDKAFLEEKGLDLIFGSIEFYLDRVEFDGNKGKYVLLEVTGPNEYKEDVNNNTFLNQMLKHSLELAIKLIEDDSINKTNLNYDLVSLKERMLNLSENIYIPSTNSNGIIPENDTFDKLPVFDMEQYRKDLADPNFENIYNSMYFNKFQLIKQADIVMLFNNLPDLYNHDTMKRNFDYYEPLTMHDSSLSNIFHAIVASKIGEDELGYEFFKKATKTDLGDNMSSCDDGIHAASLTAIMLIVYRGFLGVDTFGGELKINPRLPKNWNSISGNLWFKNRRFKINVKGAEVELSPLDGNNNPIKAIINGIEKEFNF